MQLNRIYQYIKLWIAFYVFRQFRKMPSEAKDFIRENILPKYESKKRSMEVRLLNKILSKAATEGGDKDASEATGPMA